MLSLEWASVQTADTQWFNISVFGFIACASESRLQGITRTLSPWWHMKYGDWRGSNVIINWIIGNGYWYAEFEVLSDISNWSEQRAHLCTSRYYPGSFPSSLSHAHFELAKSPVLIVEKGYFSIYLATISLKCIFFFFEYSYFQYRVFPMCEIKFQICLNFWNHLKWPVGCRGKTRYRETLDMYGLGHSLKKLSEMEDVL